MFSFKSIVLIAAAFILSVESSGVAVPAAVTAPLVAPAHIEYAPTVPYNVPPYASQISYVNRGLSPLAVGVAAPFAAPLAAPLAAPFPVPIAAGVPAPLSGPIPAGFPAPFGRFAGSYLTGLSPAPYSFPGPFPAYAAPYPYGASYGALSAPAFIR